MFKNKLELLNSICRPLLGFVTTVSGIVVSFEAVTQVIQLIAAVIAIFVGLGTLRLTYINIKKAKKK